MLSAPPRGMIKDIRQCQHVIVFLFRAIKSTIITAPIEIYFLSGNYLFKANARNTKTSSDITSNVNSNETLSLLSTLNFTLVPPLLTLTRN